MRNELDHARRKAAELLNVMVETRAKLKAAGVSGAEYSRGMDESVASWLFREFAIERDLGKRGQQ